MSDLHDSIRGYTREDIYPDGQVPPWLHDVEAQHGTLLHSGAMAFPDGRQIHVSRFERIWRVTLTNPANPDGAREVDVWLTYECLEAILLLYSLAQQPAAEPWQHLKRLVGWTAADEAGVEEGETA